MNEDTPQPETPAKKPWYRQELVIFIGGSVIIAFVLVVISLAMYMTSGASLLDLSRPGYQAVQDKVDQAGSFEAFSSSGVVTKQTLDQFQQLYEKQVKPVSSSSDFDSASLSDLALGINDPQTSDTTSE